MALAVASKQMSSGVSRRRGSLPAVSEQPWGERGGWAGTGGATEPGLGPRHPQRAHLLGRRHAGWELSAGAGLVCITPPLHLHNPAPPPGAPVARRGGHAWAGGGQAVTSRYHQLRVSLSARGPIPRTPRAGFAGTRPGPSPPVGQREVLCTPGTPRAPPASRDWDPASLRPCSRAGPGRGPQALPGATSSAPALGQRGCSSLLLAPSHPLCPKWLQAVAHTPQEGPTSSPPIEIQVAQLGIFSPNRHIC